MMGSAPSDLVMWAVGIAENSWVYCSLAITWRCVLALILETGETVVELESKDGEELVKKHLLFILPYLLNEY